MAVNPLGLQILADGGIPQTFTGYVSTDQAALSGGFFVAAGSKTAPVTSGAASFISSDILLQQASGVNYCVGVACDNAISGTPITVLQKGIIIAQCDSDTTQGMLITANRGMNAVGVLGSEANPVVVMYNSIGRALTAAGSEQFILARIDL